MGDGNCTEFIPRTFPAVSYSPGGEAQLSGSVSVDVNDDCLFMFDSPLAKQVQLSYPKIFVNRVCLTKIYLK